MKEMNRRDFLAGAILVTGGFLAERETRMQRWEKEVGFKRGDRVHFDSWGVFGSDEDSSKKRVGPKEGKGRVTTFIRNQGILWARVDFEAKDSIYDAAWHKVGTVEKVD